MKSFAVLLLIGAIDAKQLQSQHEAPLGYIMMQSNDDPCVGMGCNLHTVGSKTAFGDFPKGYAVPNFGKDEDVITTANSIEKAQNATGSSWVMGTAESKAQWHNKALDTKYNFDQPLDSEIVVSQSNLKDTESVLGHQLNIQVASSSDPICSSAGCTQYGHPAPADSVIEPPPAVVGYKVPSFGKDPDMETTWKSIGIAEKMNNHKFVMGTAESKAKWHIVAKDTLYDYQPALDKDVITTNRNIAAAEDLYGKPM
jgi:hypothetical protein